jgi:hypothetical protein
MKFRKTVAGFDFSFEESRAMMEVVFTVKLDNYPFLMFDDGDKWIIVGNVPPFRERSAVWRDFRFSDLPVVSLNNSEQPFFNSFALYSASYEAKAL